MKFSIFNFQFSNRREEGQSFIEVIVALAASVIIVTAITSAVISGLNNATFSKNQNLATAYAQEGIEIIKRMKESDWDGFKTISDGDYCMAKDNPYIFSTSLRVGPNCDQNIDDFFVREVEIKNSSNSCGYQDINGNTQYAKEATVRVKWNDSKCKDPAAQNIYCRKVSFFTCVTDLQGVLPL